MRQKPYLAVVLALVVLASLGLAQTKKAAVKPAGAAPNKAHLQQIWDGWSTLDPTKVAEFYATGPHTFFDVAPLKYNSWDEYQAGVTKELTDYKSAKFTVNDDADLHPAGEFVWGTATVKEDATMKSGKREMSTFRWTFFFGRQDGKWVIVHEHVSVPMS
jgi:ketosteroid isomerase-like protein